MKNSINDLKVKEKEELESKKEELKNRKKEIDIKIRAIEKEIYVN